MNNRPLVSVLMLTFNHEDFILEALTSVEKQNYPLIEVIVGDDASIDMTRDLIDNYSLSSRLEIKKVYNLTSIGITNNFNKCLNKCLGDFVFLLGGDDLMLPNKIQTQVDFMLKNPDTTISYHNVDVFDSDTNQTLYQYNNAHGKFSGGAQLLIERGTFCCGCSVAVRNVDLPECDRRIKFASDWLWYIEIIFKNGGEVSYFDGIYSRYRRHSKILLVSHRLNNSCMKLKKHSR